jgi:hypothetical protein
MEFNSREQRVIMLETQTPAYARSVEARHAIDLQYRTARNMKRSFVEAGINVPVNVRVVVPHNHKFVSGLNVPSNYKTCVGQEAINAHAKLTSRAKSALVGRNR